MRHLLVRKVNYPSRNCFYGKLGSLLRFGIAFLTQLVYREIFFLVCWNLTSWPINLFNVTGVLSGGHAVYPALCDKRHLSGFKTTVTQFFFFTTCVTSVKFSPLRQRFFFPLTVGWLFRTSVVLICFYMKPLHFNFWLILKLVLYLFSTSW